LLTVKVIDYFFAISTTLKADRLSMQPVEIDSNEPAVVSM
jgi:hypothetical protein